MSIKSGDMVEVLMPPWGGFNSIPNRDWTMAIGKKFRVGRFDTNSGEEVKLIGSPMHGVIDTNEPYVSWWWPINYLKLAERHAVEVF